MRNIDEIRGGFAVEAREVYDPFCDHDNCVCWEGVTLRHGPCSLLDDSSD